MFCVRPVIVCVRFFFLPFFFLELIFYLAIIWRIGCGDVKSLSTFLPLFFHFFHLFSVQRAVRRSHSPVHMWWVLDEWAWRRNGAKHACCCRGQEEGGGYSKRARHVILGAPWEEKKTSYLSRELFPLLNFYQSFIEFNMFMVGGAGPALASCACADCHLFLHFYFKQCQTCMVWPHMT